jgi:hypothetical protein
MLIRSLGSLFSGARKGLGLALVLTALASQAMAFHSPEIDPGSILSAMTLLTGGMAIILDRRRKS